MITTDTDKLYQSLVEAEGKLRDAIEARKRLTDVEHEWHGVRHRLAEELKQAIDFNAPSDFVSTVDLLLFLYPVLKGISHE